MQDTWILSLGWEDSLEEGKATHPSISAWKIPMHRVAWKAAVRGVAKSQKWQWLSMSMILCIIENAVTALPIKHVEFLSDSLLFNNL